MNTTLATSRRHAHPPDTTPTATQHPVAERRVGAVDRAALHLGVALIKWGRRPVAGLERRASRVERALLRRQLMQQLEREAAVSRYAGLLSHMR